MKYQPWPIVSLGSRTRFISGGTPNKSEERFWGGDIPWISSAEMANERIRDTTHLVTEDGARSGTRLVPENTVLVVVRGMSLANECRVSLTTRWSTFNQDVKALSLSADLYPAFVFYYLKSQKLSLRDAASEAAHGTKKLDMAVLEQWPFPIIPLSIQRKIAAILTVYDDLIETNKRRIALLEKMAEEIYREWFVRRRFPAYQGTKFIKGVPEGWEVRDLSECADINPSSLGKTDRPDLIHYVDIGSVTTNKIEDVEPIPLSEAPGRAKRCVQHGDIIWSSVRPSNRAYCLIYEPAKNTIVSTGFSVIRPKPETPFTFLNFAVTSDGFVDQMAAVAKGAAYPATSFDDFKKAKLLWPGVALLQDFHKVCEPLFRQKHTLAQQTRILTKTRDLLLPRLISGKLSVADLDIQFPPSMSEDGKEQGQVS